MKKKLFMLLSLASLALVSFNSTACSKDDDDDKQEIKDAASQGKEDGEAFAESYNNIKKNGVISSANSIKKLMTLGKKYRASEDKVYKTSFISAACGATDLAEDKVLEILNLDSVDTIRDFLKELFGDSGEVSTENPSEN